MLRLQASSMGFPIIRTAYGPGSDEQFQHALGLIGFIAQVWADKEVLSVQRGFARYNEYKPALDQISTDVDLRPNNDFVRRYQNDILEDEQLDGASVTTVREYYKDWVTSKEGSEYTGDMCYVLHHARCRDVGSAC
ncbi:hypothetical protein FBEOM_12972 [Fusarium beomiforme]|uniref:Uncharacterized protein n=1 Tax=Fusarium beomiforme TaxID=44412 RepID=A0A9P5DNQ1_9HYPO|nr:hypothetical protein FBEOM_12972 [Fusarium beomiforme]